jgi:hypothetical protein
MMIRLLPWLADWRALIKRLTNRKSGGAAQGKSLKELVNRLLDAFDPDKQIDKSKELFNTDTQSDEHIKQVTKELPRYQKGF